jgi:hypothetical protein
MAGITFNIILIRVYKDRLRLAESHADTGYPNGNKTLSGLRFGSAHSRANRTTLESQATHRANEEHCVEMVMREEIEN